MWTYLSHADGASCTILYTDRQVSGKVSDKKVDGERVYLLDSVTVVVLVSQVTFCLNLNQRTCRAEEIVADLFLNTFPTFRPKNPIFQRLWNIIQTNCDISYPYFHKFLQNLGLVPKPLGILSRLPVKQKIM